MIKLVVYPVLVALIGWYSINTSHADPFDISTLQVGIEHVDGMALDDFNGDNAQDILLVGRDASKQKQLQIITLNQGKPVKYQAEVVTLDNAVLFFDTAKLAGNDKQTLLFLQPGRVMRYDVADKKLHLLLNVDTIYRHSVQQTTALSQLTFAIDINGDGLSDFILPDFKQNWVFIQRPEGGFAAPQALEVLAEMRLFRNKSAVYAGSPVFLADFNFDGEADLIFRSKSDLLVFFQHEGVFTTKAKKVTLDLALPLTDDYDDLNKDHSDKVTHSFFRLSDLNNDNILDLVTKVTKSSGFFDKSSQYQFYFGKESGRKSSKKSDRKSEVEFPQKPDSVISSEGLQFELTLVDINGDNTLDLVSPSYELGVGSIISSLFSSSADLDVMFHPLHNGTYQTKANLEKELTVDFDLSSGQQVYPLLKISDFDGDGHKDLLLGHGSKKIYLYKGVNGGRLFAKRSQRFKIPLPRDGHLVTHKDLNNDGKTDLVIRYDKLDGQGLGNSMKILLAR
ncbi:MAG: VCBS repeat-containing protein [Algicola sp.]|nr:VCBS repeat-containing protein [Algicola sp.]